MLRADGIPCGGDGLRHLFQAKVPCVEHVCGAGAGLGDLQAEQIKLRSQKYAVVTQELELGAAGGIEAVYSALAVHYQLAPPTINLTTPDADCDLDYVPGSARAMKIDVAISNSFGFGGTNGTLVFRKLA